MRRAVKVSFVSSCCHPAFWIEITLCLSVWFLSVGPMLRGWTKLFRIGPDESIDQRQVKWVRPQPQAIEGTRQSPRRMLGGSSSP